MKTTGLLITLSGIDGAGKSTVAKKLQEFFLTQKGRNSRHIWCKFGETPLTSLGLSRRISDKPYSVEKSSSIPSEKRTTLIRSIYLSILLFFHFIKIYFSVFLPLKKGEIVICDRYIFDTLTDLRQQNFLSYPQSKQLFLKSWIPTPDFSFLLNLPESCAFNRKDDISSVAFLSQRRQIYMEIAKDYKLQIIDASQSPQAVFNSVLETITTSYR